MGTRSELGVDRVLAAIVEPPVDPPAPAWDDTGAGPGAEVEVSAGLGGPGAVSLSGVEMFIAAKAIRRVRLPASLRRGRHRATTARPALRGPKDRGVTPPVMHLVDVDGDTETMRIALRRSFEEIYDTDWSDDEQESVAG